MAPDAGFSPEQPLDTLVAGALDGHAAAWDALVHRLQRVVWKAVNMLTTDPMVRDDAFAATWLRLAERLDTIREPEKLPGWLTTTARNEVRQIVRRRDRQHRSLTESWGSSTNAADLAESLPGDEPDLDAAVLADEQSAVVRAAFHRLDDGCRELITVLVLTDPPLPYDEASAVLGRPVGSLGPSRRRCLDKMRALLEQIPGGTS